VDRLACVDVPALPLQMLLGCNPSWAEHPAAVVAEDKPQALVLWINAAARRAGILPGSRYAAALSLSPMLRAGVVSAAEITRVVDDIAACLRKFSPRIEIARDEPGVFWADVSGLERIQPSLASWTRDVRAALRAAGWHATVVAGFTRFGTYAVAKAMRGARVFDDDSAERTAACDVSLDRLAIPANARDGLLKLGIRTVGDCLGLPAQGLRERFGVEIHRLHALASGDAWAPLQPSPEVEPVRRVLWLDDAEADFERLLFLFKRLSHPLLTALAARGAALVALDMRLQLASRNAGDEARAEQIRPAAPTLDPVQILELVRLRFEARPPSAGVVRVELEAHGAHATPEQIRLFREQTKRDLAAGNRALARLRAELGEDAIVRAVLREGHMPEAMFRWERLDALAVPRPKDMAQRTLVRRLRAKPAEITARPSHAADWMLANVTEEAVAEQRGPYLVSGGWWAREVHRAYYFLWTRQGELLWAYFDHKRRRWYLQGRVE